MTNGKPNLASVAVKLVTDLFERPGGRPSLHRVHGEFYYAKAAADDEVINIDVWPASFGAEGEAARVVLAKPTTVDTPQTNGLIDPVVNVPDTPTHKGQ